MKRTLYSALVNWKNAPNRKPLILQGARQVGKTWLTKEFGKKEADKGLSALKYFCEQAPEYYIIAAGSLLGALTEQFVAQQLKINHDLYYWVASNGTAEVDFLIQSQNNIISIEVKAEENLKAKSLKVFVDKYASNTAIRTSMSRFRAQEWLTNVPLYAIYVLPLENNG